MNRYSIKLRYFPGDSLEEIRERDLKNMEREWGINISYAKIENREMEEGLLMEKTLDKKIEDISQEIITVSTDKEDNFSKCIIALYKKYRCPRTPYSLLGSNDLGEKIAKSLMNLYGGW